MLFLSLVCLTVALARPDRESTLSILSFPMASRSDETRLMDWRLSLWSSAELFEQASSPGREVRVDQDTKVKDGGAEQGDTFVLENYGEEAVEFRCPTKEKKAMWMAHLYQHACDQKRWRQAAVDRMEVLSPDTKPGLGRSVGRTRSKLLLHYNETKI